VKVGQGNVVASIPTHDDTSGTAESVPAPPQRSTIPQGEAALPVMYHVDVASEPVVATDRCAVEEPQLQDISAGHSVACFFPRL
jgi:hypothetical protein